MSTNERESSKPPPKGGRANHDRYGKEQQEELEINGGRSKKIQLELYREKEYYYDNGVQEQNHIE